MLRPFTLTVLLFSFAGADLLVGCGGGAPQTGTAPLPSTGLQRQMSELRPTDGGEFSAQHKGTIDRSGDCNRHGDEYIDFLGQGDASFLHRSHEFGAVLVKKGSPGCAPVEGYFDFTSETNPKGTIYISVRFTQDWKATYTVTRGTGRFAKATGSGTCSFTLTGDSYEDTWSGTLNF